MQRIGTQAARVFKALAGIKKDESLSSYLIALYLFLFLVAMTLLALWISGTPLDCTARGQC
jgi:hypothetical protein